MSRCFPYPPPGYALSSERNEALIEWIKEKQRKKEKRREKNEKRKERKVRRKEKATQNLDKSDIIKDHVGQKICSDPKIEFFKKRRATESDQFEQSSLTEEHGHADSLPVSGSSYESTENSNKRKRHSSSPISDSHNHGHGKRILIRIPSKMQSDFHALADGQQLCSVSGRTDFPSQHKDDTGFNGRPENFGCTSEGAHNVGRGFAPRSNFEKTCSTSRQIELQYEDLLENCFPPRLENASLYPVDYDWLFQDRRRNRDIQREKRQRCGSESIPCSRSSSLWPQAEYLLEVDAYALPFVVPY